jgi:hypothetical protein
LAKLKLVLGRKLVHSLANLRLLAEVKKDLPLLKLGFLLGREEMESSEGLKLLVELMDSSLVKLVLLVDVKSAPHAKHTASRTSWLHTCKDSKTCQSIFPEN